MQDGEEREPIIQKRCAVVGIVGRTNAGKSTLLNQLVGEKVSIVSPVAQTTRNTIRGILTEERGQLVFLDTPGLHKAEGTLGTLLNRMARQSAAGVDVLVVLFDGSRHPRLEDEGWMRRVLFAEQSVLFVLNKADLGNAREPLFREMWDRIRQEKGIQREVEWLSVSALKKTSVQPLLDRLFELAMPMEELLFPEDVVTDYPRKLAISDTIREKFLMHLKDEVPHELGILVDKIDETVPGCWNVLVTVYVNRPSQKGIVIGNKGRVLKAVTQAAQRELTDIFGVKVSVDLWVKIERNWMKNFWLLRQMGYAGANA